MSRAIVEVRVDIGGSDGIPHTFLHIIKPDGSVIEYGLVPQEMEFYGNGMIAITGTREKKHMNINLAQIQSQYQMNNMINL